MPFSNSAAGIAAKHRFEASIKNPVVYEALKRKGVSKTLSAKISNSQAANKRGK
jgi:hypothetical protein